MVHRRREAHPHHCAYLDEAPARHGIEVLLSGSLTSDSGQAMRGSFFLLDAPDRAAIEALFAADPLGAADDWQSRSVSAVTIRQNRMG
ncbi:MAG: YciI family protein [Roseovarius sp.]